MKGVELSEKYFEKFGMPMLEKDFAFLLPALSAGLVGQGCECLFFDDDVSKDHDFEPGFCIFLSDADYEKYGFDLTRAYNKLPDEFLGFSRLKFSPAGGSRHGVFSCKDFYESIIGRSSAPKITFDWLKIPPYALRTAVSGKLFINNCAEFSRIREVLQKGFPEDVRLKKIAAHALSMSQSGQYNYPRLIARGETGAAQLAIFEFVKSAISCVYLLNNVYEPFYKWAYRGMRELTILSDVETALSFLTECGNSTSEAKLKNEIIADVSGKIIAKFRAQKISDEDGQNLDKHALSINDKIKDVSLRNSSIFIGL